MSGAVAWAVCLGTVLGLGLWSLVSLTPRFGRPRLAQRVAPYLLDVSEEARTVVQRTTPSPLPVLGILFAPFVHHLARSLSALLGGAENIQRRLRQAGSRQSVEEFRATQLVWAVCGGTAGAVAAVVLPAVAALPVPARIALPVVAALACALLRELALQKAASSRMARMRSELPTVLEFLTLSLSAREGILDGLRRVAATSSGELARELFGVIADVHSGIPVASALTALSRRLELPPLTRFVDQVTGALDRGTPLADVLRAQAVDAREEAKRELLESAGRKEVAMMVPTIN